MVISRQISQDCAVFIHWRQAAAVHHSLILWLIDVYAIEAKLSEEATRTLPSVETTDKLHPVSHRNIDGFRRIIDKMKPFSDRMEGELTPGDTVFESGDNSVLIQLFL